MNLKALRSNRAITGAAWITFLSFLAKGIGFLVPVFISRVFGVTGETDAFFFAFGVVYFLATVFSGVVEPVLVPFIATLNRERHANRDFLASVLYTSILSLPVFTVICLTSLHFLLPAATSFSPEATSLIFSLLLEISPLILLMFITSIFQAALNERGIFWLPAVSPALRAVFVLATAFFWGREMGIHSLTLGYVVAEIIRLIVLGYWLIRNQIMDFRFRLQFNSHMRQFLKACVYVLVVSIWINFSPIMDRMFASHGHEGAISLLEYARNLYYGVLAITGGFFTVLLANWSSRFQNKNIEDIRGEVFGGAKLLLLFCLVLSLLLLPLSSFLVRALYGGRMSANEAAQVAILFRYFLLSVAPYTISFYFAQAFIALKNTRVLMQAAVLCNVTNLILNWTLFPRLGLKGLVLSTALTHCLGALWVAKNFPKLKDYEEGKI